MASASSEEAFVTLATNDSYALGALVLGHSLRQVGTTRRLTIMITTGVSDSLRQMLKSLYDSVSFVDALNSNDTVNLQLLTRPDLGVTFTKLHCWRLTQFSKCVFLDADTLVVQNIDDLFEREELSAAPDVGWPDCFNSGVFVFRPSLDTYRALLSFAITNGSFDGGDQGLLNSFFSDWATKDIKKRLPFVYNVVSQAFYSYQPAVKQFGKGVKVVHFIGATKPWHLAFNIATLSVELPGGAGGDISASAEFLQLWWKVFMDRVHPNLDASSIQLSGMDLCRLTLYTAQQLSDEHRQQRWEKGQVDYLGIDAFVNIQRQLDTKLQQKPGKQEHQAHGKQEHQAHGGQEHQSHRKPDLPILDKQEHERARHEHAQEQGRTKPDHHRGMLDLSHPKAKVAPSVKISSLSSSIAKPPSPSASVTIVTAASKAAASPAAAVRAAAPAAAAAAPAVSASAVASPLAAYAAGAAASAAESSRATAPVAVSISAAAVAKADSPGANLSTATPPHSGATSPHSGITSPLSGATSPTAASPRSPGITITATASAAAAKSGPGAGDAKSGSKTSSVAISSGAKAPAKK